MWICFECVYILYYNLQFKRMKQECEMEKGNEEARWFSYGYVRIVETLEPHYRNKAYKIFLLSFIIQVSLCIVAICIVLKHRLITSIIQSGTSLFAHHFIFYRFVPTREFCSYSIACIDILPWDCRVSESRFGHNDSSCIIWAVYLDTLIFNGAAN